MLNKMDLENLAKDLTIFINHHYKTKKQIVLFVCGKSIDDQKSGRFFLSKALEKDQQIKLASPEILFEGLLTGQTENSLLEFENILAQSVDGIILLPESPGSFTELGAFVSNEELRKRLICIADLAYKKKKSFINHGPLRLIKKSKYGKVIDFDYKNFASVDEIEILVQKIKKIIKTIQKTQPLNKSIAHLFECESFIQMVCLVLGTPTFEEIKELFKFSSKQSELISSLTVKASLNALIKTKYLEHKKEAYRLSALGREQFRDSLSKKDAENLEKARFETMNCQNRANAKYKNVYSNPYSLFSR